MTTARAERFNVNSSDDADNLPEGWTNAPFLDVIDYAGGAQPPKKDFVYEPRPGYVRLLQIRDFGEKPFPTYVRDSPHLKKANKNDLLVARYGGGEGDDCLGRVCTGLEGAYNVALVRLVFPQHLVDPGFIRCFFLGPWFKTAINVNSRSCQMGFNQKDLLWLQFPLAPLAEQKRIVAKVEELLVRVNAGRERLDGVPKIMKRFRQAVLAAACSGRLTEDWRENNPGVEPASQVLKGIAHEKRSGARAAVDDVGDLNGLPETWQWATFGDITVNHDAKRVPVKSDDRTKRRGRYPYYGASGIIDTIDDYLFDGSFLLVAEDGANLEMRSTPIAFQAHGRFWVNNHAHVVQTRMGIPLGYLEACLNGMDIQDFITGSAQPKLTQANMNNLPVPVPPLAEQEEIVRRVEALFKLADAIEKRVAAARLRADKLTQSILAKAFRGELVPAEAELARREGRGYEPASVLLERIRAEREKGKPQTKKGRTRG